MTSLVDIDGFRDKGERSVEALQEHLAREIQKEIPDSRRMFPYVQRHEFEGLLFSDTNAFRAVALASEQYIEVLSKIRRQFKAPEDINDDPEGAPNKRIERTVRGYRRSSMDRPSREKQAWRKSARSAAVSRLVEVLGRIERKHCIELSMRMR